MFQNIIDSKLSKFIAHLLIVVLLFNNLIFPGRALALTDGPVQQEYLNFEPASSTDMVNLFTGDFTYNIPLLDVDGYPVNLSYHASPGIDEEASWVGLGWTINSGAISRNVRGLPDDFKDEEIVREVSMKDHQAWGVIAGGGFEIAGKGSFSAGAGVVYSNYKGYGYEFFAEPSASFGAGDADGLSGRFSAGMGLKVNSQEGATFNAGGGLMGQMGRGENAHSSAGLGGNIGVSTDSRLGRTAWSAGVSGNYSRTHRYENNDKTFTSGSGQSVSHNVTIPLGSRAFSPRLDFNRTNGLFSFDIKIGGANCAAFGYGVLRGFYTQSTIKDEDIRYRGYGYLYEHETKERRNKYNNVLLDFAREKDGMFYAETPNAPVTNHTFDMYLATAQGLYGAFRAGRNDIGVVYDPKVKNIGYTLNLGGELGIGAGVNVGVNSNFVRSTSESGFWEEGDDNKLNSRIGFKKDEKFTTASPANAAEEVYFKMSGEKTFDNTTFQSQIGGEQAVRPVLESVGKKKYKTTDKIEYSAAQYPQSGLSANTTVKTERVKRNSLIDYLTADEASAYGIETSIRNYNMNTSSSGALGFPFTYASIARNGGSAQPHHLSEIRVQQTNGSRYVYGIPVYNKTQKDVSFAVSATSSSNGLITIGSENIRSPKTNRDQKTDQYFESNSIPAYAHSYLLTHILSADYVDRTQNGVTDDDLGNFTLFRYSKQTSDYDWRMPVSSANTAYYSEGMYADTKDQRGSYSHGTREVWYPRAIETKNAFAEFILEDRLDGLPASGENGGINTGNKLKRLKQIKLYSKPRYDADPPTLIKTVNFEYEYALCPGTPNSIGTNGAKLTLKKVWTTLGNSVKGDLTPYTFYYCDPAHTGNPAVAGSSVIDPVYNPLYAYNSTDRWGTYKSASQNPGSGLSNVEYPYCLQATGKYVLNDEYANYWNLHTIYTPTGSKISVDYESDNYAYVNDKRAAQMYKIKNFGYNNGGNITTVPSQTPGRLYSSGGAQVNDNSTHIYLDLDDNSGGIPSGVSDKRQYFIDNYLRGENKIYFRCSVRLNPNDQSSYEYVPGYAELDLSDINIQGNTVRLKMVDVELGDELKWPFNQGIKTKVNPITKAALQLGRMQLPKVMYPGSEPAGSTDAGKMTSLFSAFSEVKAMYKGVNRALVLKNFCNKANLNKSFIRLFNPAGKKYGGGSRVKSIKITDAWLLMTNGSESTSEYGQTFTYETTEGGATISSGVASYEPLLGGDENSNRRPIIFSVHASATLNNSFLQEEPYSESFYPNAVVGYSKVTVKNLARTNVTRNATGSTVHEYYTTVDFPTKEERTSLNKKPVKPRLGSQVFKVDVQERLYLSQGFVIKTNDMHGKLKSVKTYGENQTTPISGITYNYKTKPGTKELDNKVSVLGPDRSTELKEIGVETDIVNDARSSKSEIMSNSGMVNVSTFVCSYYIPVVYIWGGFSRLRTEFYSSTLTKTVQKFGILESVETFNNNSRLTTTNHLWDKETGEVLLSSSNNQFDKPVYTFSYPAYWAYEGMSSAYKNHGMEFLDACPYLAATQPGSGKIVSSLSGNFYPGDEVAVYAASSVGTGPALYYKKGSYVTTLWVIKDLAPGYAQDLYFIDKDGRRANTSNVFTNASGKYIFKIIRSGRRNLQTNTIGSITSLSHPVSGGAVNISSNVLSASALEYDDKWNGLCETCDASEITKNIGVTGPVSSIVCSPSSAGTAFFGGLSQLVANSYGNSHGLYNLLSPVGNANVSPVHEFYNKIEIFPWVPFVEKSEMYSGWEALKEYLMCDNYCYNVNPYNGPSKLELGLSGLFSGSHSWQSSQGTVQAFFASSTHNIMTLQFNGHSNWNWLQTFPIPLKKPKKDFCLNSSSQKNVVLSLPGTNSWDRVVSIGNMIPVSTTNGTTFKFEGDAVLINPNATVKFTGEADPSTCFGDFGSCTTVAGVSPPENCLINPYLNGLRGNWRPKRTYDYFTTRSQAANQGSVYGMSGDIAKDGVYSTFTPFWTYSGTKVKPVHTLGNTSAPYNLWIKTSETDKADGYGNVHTAKDPLGKPSASIYGYNMSLLVASASNAYSNEILSDGFEDTYENNALNADVNLACHTRFRYNYGVPNTNVNPSNATFHTGTKSLMVAPNNKAEMQGRFADMASATSNNSYADVYSSRPSASQGIYIYKPGDNIDNFGPFSPVVRPDYVVSVWVKVALPTANTPPIAGSYSNVGVKMYVKHNSSLNFINRSPVSVESSPIINGWQKLDYRFSLTSYGGVSAQYALQLYNNNSNVSAYFDDLRIHPYNSTMVTKVYNPKTFQLMAELDDKNYATYYQYDADMALVRVNQETERGIFTLKETRSSLKK